MRNRVYSMKNVATEQVVDTEIRRITRLAELALGQSHTVIGQRQIDFQSALAMCVHNHNQQFIVVAPTRTVREERNIGIR